MKAVGSGAWAFRYGLAVLLVGITISVAAWAVEPPEIPVPGMVTVASFGAVNCVPCRMMVPIREELQREYEGRVAIVFIDLHRHYELIDQYAIRVIPTLIFYDQNGNEAKRHIGFMDKKSIEAEMAKLGVE
ncbi:thiol reductase thioredoxin [Desulfonatronum sp. SC1]|nr:thiol reductase thioredoxin [Desulfonatronum sp. SC1]